VIRTKETGIAVNPGDRFEVASGGGGGWGDPAARSAAARADDVESGFVSGSRCQMSEVRGRTERADK